MFPWCQLGLTNALNRNFPWKSPRLISSGWFSKSGYWMTLDDTLINHSEPLKEPFLLDILVSFLISESNNIKKTLDSLGFSIRLVVLHKPLYGRMNLSSVQISSPIPFCWLVEIGILLLDYDHPQYLKGSIMPGLIINHQPTEVLNSWILHYNI